MKYWNDRYKSGVGAGSGSRGRLAEFKLETVQRIVNDCGIESVVDVGCGDGSQLRGLDVKSYRGIDPSDVAIDQAIEASEKKAPDWVYHVMDAESVSEGKIADMTVSLDVLFHLPQDQYDAHLDLLFGLAKKYVLIYAPDHDGSGLRLASHMFFREFVGDVKKRFGVEPELHIKNQWPASFIGGAIRNDTSFCEFYLFPVAKESKRRCADDKKRKNTSLEDS